MGNPPVLTGHLRGQLDNVDAGTKTKPKDALDVAIALRGACNPQLNGLQANRARADGTRRSSLQPDSLSQESNEMCIDS